MTTKTKTRCLTVLIVFAAAVLFAGACYRAEQTRLSAGLTASCFAGHCASVFTAL
ncbi:MULTISPECIES: hypothetical protein [Pseudomonas]|jgi:hypothetical protein|uniref:Lipoprotein n=1 Tax=Pseudomonas helleri TaxID=1608996 RepID=A0A6A7ZGQ9_9PSED|nr:MULTISPECIES: hypothetical protein [Pseudomonas]MDU7558078.1 hypothetical protein [Pseudomonas sp.]MQT37063.1 hypothetical protein [Pseudomonas helleri]MQT74638.1 hypothetical protein [Pseudomonas helleri]MQT93707.1 hypothetical protein [Pseudomonas helleri]MQU05531.1 hypothetical protein [Pseudomonas helleri]